MQELESDSEITRKFLEALRLEDRLEGLTDEQILVALPDNILRCLQDEALSTLPVETRKRIRKRIGR